MLIFLVGCTTEKNTPTTRAYHNLTAKYNVYFNGNEAYKKGLLKLKTSHKDDFTKLLPIFLYTDPNSVSTVAGNMEKAVKKASKTIKYHSIKVKPKKPKGSMTKKDIEFRKKKEYSFLLMGKALFYKKEFYPAIQNFEFVISQFGKENLRIDAMMWLARTYIEQKRFKKAKNYLDLVEGDKEFDKKKKLGEFSAIYADFYIKQDKLEDATTKLLLAIETTRKKQKRTRYKYILAQIYQQFKDYGRASKLFKEVVKMNPPYEMAFNAKINQASSFDPATDDTKALMKQLRKMLKDDKNIEYQDQIYYAIANIYLKQNNFNDAITNYNESITTSVVNDQQKALSFLALADIYYKNLSYKDYKLAQMNYDSCLIFLNNDYRDYDKLNILTKNLTELVNYSSIIEFEDSVQLVAKMSKKDRNALIQGIIDKITEEEARQKELAAQERINAQMFNQQRGGGRMNNVGAPQGGGWYFYNQSTLSFGSNEFKKKWGRRKLEDNWRRKNKSIEMEISSDEEGEEGADTVQTKELSNKTPEYYLQNIPLTDSALVVSNTKIEESLFHLGNVYRTKMMDYKLAIKSFEELNTRFPKTDYQLLSYYDLYLTNDILKNTTRKNYYKGLITKKYPDSKFSKLLNNPNYIKELEANAKIVQNIYAKTFADFNNNNLSEVIKNYNNVKTKYKDDALFPKFELLYALSFQKQQDTVKCKELLIKIISNYPNNEVAAMAQDVFNYITYGGVSKEKKPTSVFDDVAENNTQAKDTTQANVNKELYSFNEKSPHYFLIIVDTKNTDVNRLKFNISNFNIDYFNVGNYKVSALLLNKNINVITVKSFDGAKAAMSYFNSINDNKDVFKTLKKSEFRNFVISSDNYKTFYKDKNVNKYIKFFKKNYVNNNFNGVE